MNTRLKEIVKSLPRVKTSHIKRDYVAPERGPRPLSRAERTAFERNSPIFLWDGSPVMIQEKPSIGAEHRFKKGYFRGVDGRKSKYLADMRFRGTRFVPAHEEQMPNNFWHLDDRTNKLYEPVTLGDIQRLVDLGRLDKDKLIDINALVNARLFEPADLLWSEDIMGIRLVAQGANQLAQPLNIEAQMADVEAIAAVERQGGQYYSAYYDRGSIEIMANPVDAMIDGVPLKKRHLPPNYLWEYYRSVDHRGYLCNTDGIGQARIELAEKYGYDVIPVPDDFLNEKKDPRCILHKIPPGTLFNMAEKKMLMSEDNQIKKYVKKATTAALPGYYGLRWRLRRLDVHAQGGFKPMYKYTNNDIDTMLGKVTESKNTSAFDGFLTRETKRERVERVVMKRIQSMASHKRANFDNSVVAVAVVNAETENAYYQAVRCTIVAWSRDGGEVIYDELLKPDQPIVQLRGVKELQISDIMKKGKDFASEREKIVELMRNKTIITHTKPDMIFGLGLKDETLDILDLATNRHIHYFMMSLTDNRYRGVKSLQDQAMFIFNNTSSVTLDAPEHYASTMLNLFSILASRNRESPDV